jgi:putative ABC transport system substrate-binding protein
MNNRRKLIVALGAGALFAPLVSYSQQAGKVWRIGVLAPRARPDSFEGDFLGGPLLKGLREHGYVEGKNLAIEWRFTDGGNERLQAYADELVKLKVDLIVAENTTATRRAQKSTATIPVVMGTSGNPVVLGLIKSLAHPGGNITGFTQISDDVSPKQLEMLLDMVPKLGRVAHLTNPTNPATMSLKRIQGAAPRGVSILPVEASTPQEIEAAFAAASRGNAGAVIVQGDGFLIQQRGQIAGLATRYRLPSISNGHEYPEAGGLMSYGVNLTDQFRRAAVYVDKIFKGAKPGDLPVEQPTKFELIINRTTAKTLGLKIPQSLLVSADKVIE